MERLVFFIVIFTLHSVLMLTMTQDTTPVGTHCPGQSRFGSNCQYKCQCTNDCPPCIGPSCPCDKDNCDDITGECENGTVCEPGWFGPACQYVDLIKEADIEPNFTEITDDDPTTCLTVTTASIYLTWKQPIFFTFMRLVMKYDTPTSKILKVSFIKRINNYGLDCLNPRYSIVDDQTVDLFCDNTGELISTVVLSPNIWITGICKIFVSAGRNVAFGERADQIADLYSIKWLAPVAVDGNRGGKFGTDSCSCTYHYTDMYPYWTLSFSKPKIVYAIRIYNVFATDCCFRDHPEIPCCIERLKGFNLTLTSSSGQLVMNYQDALDKGQEMYDLVSTTQDVPVSSLMIEATNYYPYYSPHEGYMLGLCEVFVFGETECPPNTFGRDCEHTCSCPGQCAISTGGCLVPCDIDGCIAPSTTTTVPTTTTTASKSTAATRITTGSLLPTSTTNDMPASSCPSTQEQGVVFPEIPVNSSVSINCSSIMDNYTGTVDGFCASDGTWRFPTFSPCRQIDLILAINQIEKLKSNSASLSGSEATTLIAKVSVVLTVVLTSPSHVSQDSVKKSVKTMSDVGQIVQQNKNITLNTETLQNFASFVNQILTMPTQNWTQVVGGGAEEASNILVGMDSIIGASLRGNLSERPSYSLTGNIAMKLAVTVRDIQYPDGSRDSQVLQSNITVLLKKEAFSQVTEFVNYAVVLYRNVTDKFNLLGLTPELTGSRRTKLVNSDILSFSISAEIANIDPPVELSFAHLQDNYFEPVCGYIRASNESRVIWATEGCSTRQEAGRIYCSCSHLTNFAVLMSPYGGISSQDQRNLSIISAVGCGISIVCLLVTLIIFYLTWRFSKCDRTVLHINLSTCLILAYIIFLAGVDQVNDTVGCQVVAVLLHYIFLVVFFIMLSEGVLMLQAISFLTMVKFLLLKLLAVSYGVPVIIVAVSIGITQMSGYGSQTSCWLTIKNGLIWAFVGPVLLIFVINLVILALVLRVMLATKQMQNKTERQKIIPTLRTVVFLSPILGITWIFGVLSVNQDTVVFQYIFAVLNSLQGFMVLVFTCLLTPKVQEGLKVIQRKHFPGLLDSHPSAVKTFSTSRDGKQLASKTSSTAVSESRQQSQRQEFGSDKGDGLYSEPVQTSTPAGSTRQPEEPDNRTFQGLAQAPVKSTEQGASARSYLNPLYSQSADYR